MLPVCSVWRDFPAKQDGSLYLRRVSLHSRVAVPVVLWHVAAKQGLQSKGSRGAGRGGCFRLFVLPALRTRPGNVSLLFYFSTRIVETCMELQDKRALSDVHTVAPKKTYAYKVYRHFVWSFYSLAYFTCLTARVQGVHLM